MAIKATSTLGGMMADAEIAAASRVQDRSMGSVDQALNRISNERTLLAERLDELAIRLQPVLGDEMPAVNKDGSDDMLCRCELSGKLRGEAAGLRCLAELVEHLLLRLDL